MLQVSYSERELLGDSPPCLFFKAKLVYLHYTRAILSHTSCSSGDRHKQAYKGVEGK